MNIRERLEAFWLGKKLDRIPYTIYYNEWRHTKEDPAWIPMFEAGLGVVYHIGVVKEERSNLQLKTDTYKENGHTYIRQTMITPIGQIYTLAEDGWTQKYWLETPDDYRVMIYIARNTKLKPDYEQYLRVEKEYPYYAVPLVFAGRTPIQTILVDYVGLENFSYHLYDCEEEMLELYYVLSEQFAIRSEIIAEGPGRYVSVLENFTSETMGPERFMKFLVPIYEKYYPIMQSSGKVIGNHYDGKLYSCREHITSAPIDLIESLTPPPEGDMTLAECRKQWPDKLFWSNINTANYYLPHNEMKDLIQSLVGQAAVGGTRLAFEVSEKYPDNWKTSIPVVLEALNEIII